MNVFGDWSSMPIRARSFEALAAIGLNPNLFALIPYFTEQRPKWLTKNKACGGPKTVHSPAIY